jgi:proline iminopeptidase
LGLVLRGIFLLTEAEVSWFYQQGASHIFPDAFDRYVSPIPENERHNLVDAFYKRLTGNDREERAACAKAWAQWEGSTLSLRGPSIKSTKFEETSFLDAFARIECHYFKHKGFFESDGWLLSQAKSFGDLPGYIVHGRYDVVTPLSSAWSLKKAWPAAHLKIITDAGHSSMEPGIVHELISATDSFAAQFGG